MRKTLDLDPLIHYFDRPPLTLSTRARDLLSSAETSKVLFVGLSDSGKSAVLDKALRSRSVKRPVKGIFVEEVKACGCLSAVCIDLSGSALLDCLEADDNSLSVTPPLITLLCCINSLIFVLDAQNDNLEAEVQVFVAIAKATRAIDPSIDLSVFAHKLDGDLAISEAAREVCTQKLYASIMAEMDGFRDLHLYPTSILDRTATRACSLVFFRLLPQLRVAERALQLLKERSALERVFLIDKETKLLLATNLPSPSASEFQTAAEALVLACDLAKVYLGSDGMLSQTMMLESGQILFLKEFKHFYVICDALDENFNQQALLERNVRVFGEAFEKFLADSSRAYAAELASNQVAQHAKRMVAYFS